MRGGETQTCSHSLQMQPQTLEHMSKFFFHQVSKAQKGAKARTETGRRGVCVCRYVCTCAYTGSRMHMHACVHAQVYACVMKVA